MDTIMKSKRFRNLQAEMITIMNQNKKFNNDIVIKSYLSQSTVFPLIESQAVNETIVYNYQFLPEFCPKLLDSCVEIAENYLSKCDEEFMNIENFTFYLIHENIREVSSLKTKVIATWLVFWCKLLLHQNPYEHDYRLNQLLSVLVQYDETHIEELVKTYSEIIESCYNFGSPHLTITFFDAITQPFVSSHPSVFNWYLKAINFSEPDQPFKKNDKECKNNSQATNESIYHQLYLSSSFQLFDQRTFLTAETHNVISEEIKFGYELDKCAQCKNLPEEKTPSKGTTNILQCPICENTLFGKFKVRLGRPVIYTKSESTFWEKKLNIIPIEELYSTVINFDNIDLDTLRNMEVVFWNIIFYFNVFGLPYDLFMPYKKVDRISMLLTRKKFKQKTGIIFNRMLMKEIGRAHV